jgi:hypothetical protein
VAKKRNQTRRHWRGAIRFVNSPVVASFDEIISEAASAFAFQVIDIEPQEGLDGTESSVVILSRVMKDKPGSP